ncbi:MAG: HDOD domain-containing protein, partial [Candidatus Muiribacteriota bacterium]
KTNDPHFDIKQITSLIAKDPSITAKILRIANSAFYSGASEIDTVEKAVMRLGIRQIRNIILGISVIQSFKPVDEFINSVQSIWRHSIGVAFTNKVIGDIYKLEDVEELWVCGILHDIGKILYISYFPELFSYILREARQKDISFYSAEQELFKFNHSDIGGWLADRWHLPHKVRNVIFHHHNPPANDKVLTDCTNHVAITNVSNSIVKLVGVGNIDRTVTEIHSNVWNFLDKSKIENNNMFDKLKGLKNEVDDLFNIVIS